METRKSARFLLRRLNSSAQYSTNCATRFIFLLHNWVVKKILLLYHVWLKVHFEETFCTDGADIFPFARTMAAKSNSEARFKELSEQYSQRLGAFTMMKRPFVSSNRVSISLQ